MCFNYMRGKGKRERKKEGGKEERLKKRTLKNLERRRAKIFENYLSSNLNSLEELK